MRYPRFELLALIVGSLSVLWGIGLTLRTMPVIEELVAQALLLVVLVGAVHRGRRGGIAMAIFATLAYLGLRIPMVLHEGFTRDVVLLLLMRTATYAIMGVGGGIVCSRIHQFLARFESISNIDAATQLFNEHFATTTLRSMVAQYARFHKPFSVVILTVPRFMQPKLDPATLRSLRAVATYVREGVRLIDDAARLDDGRIVLVLPQTEKPGAHIAADRISKGVIQRLGSGTAELHVQVLGAVEDLDALRELCGATITGDEQTGSVSKSA